MTKDPNESASEDKENDPKQAASDSFWLTRYSKALICLVIALVGLGVYVAFQIPTGVFPQTNFPRVIIALDNGVMPIDQMLVSVTRPVEIAVSSVQGLNDVRALTSRGTAEIDLFFDWNVDMFQTLQRVDSALATVQGTLPPGAKISSHRLTFSSFPVVGYGMTSDSMPATRLWEIATYQLAPRLNRAKGVATVTVQGGEVPEYQITPDPVSLVRTSTTVPQILAAIQSTNVVASPGLIQAHHDLVLDLVDGQVHDPAELAKIVIKKTPAGLPIRLGDVAEIHASVKPVYTVVTAHGKPAVLLSINRQPGTSTIAVASAVQKELDQLRTTLPPGIQFTTFYDQSGSVKSSLHSVRDAVLLGIVLASLVLILFLRDWGSSLVAGLVIPVTIAITFIVMHLLGESFNMMTLGGMAAAVGLVIDDAIVVVENIVRHRDLGKDKDTAIQIALSELMVPLFYSTVTPVSVFLPLVAITGVTGSFFRALAVTMGAALITSLGLALTWTPNLSQYLLGKKKKEKEASEQKPGLFDHVLRAYERLLKLALGHRWILAVFSVCVIGISFWSYSQLGSDLLPPMDEGSFVIDYIMPAGSSLTETNRVVSHIDSIVQATPEVVTTARRTGLQLGLAAVTEANTGDISVQLKSSRSRSTDAIIADVRAKVSQAEPGIHIEFGQILQDMIGDLTSAPQPVDIKLFSEDDALLRHWAPIVGAKISKVNGVVDVLNGIENTISGPAIVYQINPQISSQTGFTPEEVETDAKAILDGESATTPLVVNSRAYTIRVRFPDRNRDSIAAMNNTLLSSASGSTATLGSLAQIVNQPGQTEILQDNLQRYVAITARLEGTNLGSAITTIKQTVNSLNLPPGIRVEYGGTYQTQQNSFRSLMVVLLIGLLLVFLLLLFEFKNLSAPTAILASAVLSTSGVFVALLITGTTFNISSFMGLIMVVGIVSKNGILLLDADHKFRAEGKSGEEAMVEAGRQRLRPIAMTAIAAIAGMLPLALALGSGSQMLQPLAIAVIGGIVVSMFLSLIITPAVQYYLTEKDCSR
ncbi:MAG: efflux RND transporter permease subunit [Granulicella sp.]